MSTNDREEPTQPWLAIDPDAVRSAQRHMETRYSYIEQQDANWRKAQEKREAAGMGREEEERKR